MRVLALTRYDHTGPSSRVRFYQFRDFLAGQGLEVEVQPLLDADYVQRLLSGKSRSTGNLVGCYVRRLAAIPRWRRADLLWIEKELFPWAPTLLDPGLLGSAPYVVDYDDAVFHNYDEHPRRFVRALYATKIPRVMRGASTVIAGNPYIAEFAARSGARHIEIVPSVVHGGVYRPREVRKTSKFTVGWLGSPSTQQFLDPLWDTLAAVIDPRTDRFVTVGARYAGPVFPGHEPLGWSLEGEPQALAEFDVGIMPLRDAPFERGKCGFKLVQYMACGVPMIASPVGVNRGLVDHGVTGYLAQTPDEWKGALMRLKAEPGLRRSMSSAARDIFVKNYSFEINAPRLAAILRAAAIPRSIR